MATSLAPKVGMCPQPQLVRILPDRDIWEAGGRHYTAWEVEHISFQILCSLACHSLSSATPLLGRNGNTLLKHPTRSSRRHIQPLRPSCRSDMSTRKAYHVRCKARRSLHAAGRNVTLASRAGFQYLQSWYGILSLEHLPIAPLEAMSVNFLLRMSSDASKQLQYSLYSRPSNAKPMPTTGCPLMLWLRVQIRIAQVS